ncbi:4195_t:CDS:2 [Cetraspora pellucida]|uniref:4195_t:CDS:1 n=1 Tax=Cetraspora pellucida TaxID=1433469 RepID=A0A9N8VX36_9GLOM|nr:4195_t:CDS:2 [Cetraspora pellucida]
MRIIALLHISLAIILHLLLPSVESTCVNMFVYNECRNRGEFMKSKCAPMDFICQCDALKAIQLCFLQCTDDINIINEGKAYEPSVAQICALGTSQSLTRYPKPTFIVNPTSSIPPQITMNSISTTQKPLPKTQNGSPARTTTTPTAASNRNFFWLFNGII